MFKYPWQRTSLRPFGWNQIFKSLTYDLLPGAQYTYVLPADKGSAYDVLWGFFLPKTILLAIR